MKLLNQAALAALLAGSIGLAGLVPTYADSAAPNPSTPSAATSAQGAATPSQGPGDFAGRRPMWGGQRGMGHRGGSPLLRLACSDRGAEALEIAFVRIKYELKLTTDQQPLFDTLRTAALADQKTFADTCKAAMDDGVSPGQKSMLDRLQTELALDSAKVTALSDVVPKFKAFYDSLTDQQKAALAHLRPGHHRHFGGPSAQGQHNRAWGQGSPQGNQDWGQGRTHRMHPMSPGAMPGAPDAVPGAPNSPAPQPDDSNQS